jgi:hypothetical protein
MYRLSYIHSLITITSGSLKMLELYAPRYERKNWDHNCRVQQGAYRKTEVVSKVSEHLTRRRIFRITVFAIANGWHGILEAL